MINLRFKNNLGEIAFERGKWHLTQAEGLSLVQKLITAVRYINQPGQRVTYSVANPRTITLSGDVNLKVLGESELERACTILEKEGVLIVETDRFVRQIDCRCIEFVPGERNGTYRTFVVQLLCDIPYFEDQYETETVVYQKVPYLSKDTVLPAVFSDRIARGDISYPGSAFCEPKILVDIPDGNGELEIINRTSGQGIKLFYDSSLFSRLTVDTKNRTITDENGVDRLEILTDDSFFDGFRLEAGENLIEVLNSNQVCHVTASLIYKVRYQEAVI